MVAGGVRVRQRTIIVQVHRNIIVCIGKGLLEDTLLQVLRRSKMIGRDGRYRAFVTVMIRSMLRRK